MKRFKSLFLLAVWGAVFSLGHSNWQAYAQTVRTRAEITLKDGSTLKVDDLRWQGSTDGKFTCSSQVKSDGLDFDIYVPYANIESIRFGNRVKHGKRDYVEVLITHRSQRVVKGYNYADNYVQIHEIGMPKPEDINIERIRLIAPTN